VSLALLIASKRWFRMPTLAVQSVNTLILLLVGLPIVDFLIWPPVDLDKPEPSQHLYLYRTAQADPAGFREWCAEYDVQLKALFRNLFKVDPSRQLPYVARRGSHYTFFQSHISINDRGFRGPKIPPKKGGTYRIVALGESTTFGLTLKREDMTWPALLQQMIQERLKPVRPVEVINAGVPGFSIVENLRRLKQDILPLKPDMIISYHGYNGFRLIQPALPRVRTTGPPPYRDRPLRILADCEYRLRLIFGEHREAENLYRHPVRLNHLLQNPYARDYLALIQTARTNHIRLVLANYCMAVNSNSDLNVIQFHRKRFPMVFWQIRANEVHSAMVRRLGEEYPDVTCVDTHPGLDGKHDKFIDLVHFTQAGRRQLAENIFAGITNLLERDLSAGSVAAR
jgi:lysophospholipase L1-like esterase